MTLLLTLSFCALFGVYCHLCQGAAYLNKFTEGKEWRKCLAPQIVRADLIVREHLETWLRYV